MFGAAEIAVFAPPNETGQEFAAEIEKEYDVIRKPHLAAPLSTYLPSNCRTGPALLLRTVVISILFCIAVSIAHAQVGTSDVVGTVTDSTGAVIRGASVTLKNLDTGATRVTTSGDNGNYSFNLVSNNRYSVTVEMTGFKTYRLTEIDVTAEARARVDATLSTGVITESVTVSASEAPSMQTDSSDVGSTVGERTVQDIPLVERNLTGALQVQPGITAGMGGTPNQTASQSSGQGLYDRRPTSTVVANGQSDLYNNHLIDGFDNNERQSGLIGLSPSIDGVAEVRIDTTNYSAEYGRTAGAVVNFITKAGTNAFHGTVYEYFGNDIFNARNAYDTTGRKPEYRLNDFGGSFGGPIRKDKTFFFADVEAFRKISAITYTTGVPTAYEEAHPGDFSDVQINGATGPVIPTANLSKVALAYFALFPAPTSSGSSNNYTASPGFTQNSETYDVRIDHRFSPNNLFFARFAYNPVSSVEPEPFPEKNGIYPGGTGTNFPGPSTGKSENLQLDFVHIFSPALLLDLKAAYTRVNIQSLPFNYGTGASTKLGIPNVYIPSSPDTNVLMGVGGPSDPWGYLGDALSTPLIDINNTFQYAGSISYNHGAHSLKFGAGVLRRQVDLFQDAYAGGFFVFVGAPPYFDPRLNFMTGNPIVELRQNSLDHPGFRAWEPNVYLTDNWRASQKLTVNLGLRYDVFTPFTEAHGQYVNFNPANFSFILGIQDPHIGVKTDYHDLAPRVGFAYSVDPKMVLRGAFGLSFFPPDTGIVSLGGAQGPVSIMQNYNPPYAYNYSGGGMPGVLHLDDGPAVPSTVDLSTFKTNSNVTSLSYKPFGLHSSYVEQYNLSLQRQLGGNTITVAGVGVLGRDLARGVNLDQPGPPGANQPTAPYVYATQLPYIVSIGEVYNGSSSSYHALQVVYDRRPIKGLSLSANYTWSHGLADGQPLPSNSSSSNPSLDYGNSLLDVRNRLAAYGSYKLPFGEQAHGAKGLLTANWQLNGIGYWQSSTPFTVVNDATIPTGTDAGQAFINESGVSEDRPNVVARVSLAHKQIGTLPGQDWFNVNAFATQTIGTVGNEEVNQYFGPHDRRFDFSVFKLIPIHDQLQLQFRAECINVSNTPNFAAPTATITGWNTDSSGNYTTPSDDTPFGKVSQTLGSELPRQFQFSLKILY